MFKIRFGEIHWITITHGYYCLDSAYCDCRDKCKYNKGFKFHNWSVRVHNFFQYRLHIKLPHILYVGKKNAWLSGTTKCPYDKNRRHTCWQCNYHDGDPDGICLNPKRSTLSTEELRVNDPDWGEWCRCSLFEKTKWADKYDKNTGETILD